MPVMKTVYRTYEKEVDGKKTRVTEPVELASVDAAEAVRNHPEEYSFAAPGAPAPTAADTVNKALEDNAKKAAAAKDEKK